MSGILLGFINSGVGAITVVSDGSFSGAPIADLSFGG
jgi:hypothetical protein